MIACPSLISLRFFGDKSGVTVDHVRGGLSENVEEERKSGLDLRGLWSTSQV